MKTALYIRVSTTEQAKEGYSLASQRRRLISFCEFKNWDVVEIYSDEGVSASSLKERPEAMRMMKDFKKGIFENVLILKVDRLCRNTRDLLEVVDKAKKYNIKLNAVEEQIDYTTPTGKMMLTILGSFAELERSSINERMMAGREQKVISGIKSKTGIILFGYKYEDEKFIIIEHEAEIVRLIFNKILEGESLRGITRYLVENKVKGRSWTPSIIRRLLLNPTYKGYAFANLYDRSTNKDYINFEESTMARAHNVEPIISEEKWDQVYTILTARSRQSVRKFANADMYFADVVYCSNCGWRLYSRNAKNDKGKRRRRYYRCNFNQHNFIKRCNFTAIEHTVLERLFLNYLENIELNLSNAETLDIEETQNDNLIAKKSLIASKKTYAIRKNRLLDKFLDGHLTDEEYTSASTRINNELEAIDKKISDLEFVKKQDLTLSKTYLDFRKDLKNMNMSISDMWDSLEDNQKRLFITTLVNKMYIAKSQIVSIEFN